MCRMIQIKEPMKACRLSFRHPTLGVENDLVKAFVSEFRRILPDRDYALFLEPKLPTGYPDCVVVEYDPMAFSKWSCHRHALSDVEMRVLFLLHPRKGIRVSSLVEKIGLTERKIKNILGSLVENGDAICKNGDVYFAVVEGVRGIKSILSVEAKVNDFNRVIGQAAVNQAFSNESYVLMPRKSLTRENEELLASSRVGMFSISQLGLKRIKGIPAKRKSSSYLSLYFNEWIGWRLLTGRKLYGR